MTPPRNPFNRSQVSSPSCVKKKTMQFSTKRVGCHTSQISHIAEFDYASAPPSVVPVQTGGMQAATCVLNLCQSLGHGGFLLGNGRGVLAYNRPAATYLGDGLALRGNRLTATDRASDVRLQASIGIALLSVESRDERRSVGIRRNLRPPFVVHIHRLVHETPPKLLLVACDPELSPVPPASMLSDMFRLTPAEASVAVGIASGKQLAEIAADGGVKIETVRVHSKAIFSKTGTRGQAELAALVTRLASWSPVAACRLERPNRA